MNPPDSARASPAPPAALGPPDDWEAVAEAGQGELSPALVAPWATQIRATAEDWKDLAKYVLTQGA